MSSQTAGWPWRDVRQAYILSDGDMERLRRTIPGLYSFFEHQRLAARGGELAYWRRDDEGVRTYHAPAMVPVSPLRRTPACHPGSVQKRDSEFKHTTWVRSCPAKQTSIFRGEISNLGEWGKSSNSAKLRTRTHQDLDPATSARVQNASM